MNVRAELPHPTRHPTYPQGGIERGRGEDEDGRL